MIDDARAVIGDIEKERSRPTPQIRITLVRRGLTRLLNGAVALCVGSIASMHGQTLTTLYAFSGSDGATPNATVLQASDGNLYGTTVFGGQHDDGTIFKITPSGSLTVLHSFAFVAFGEGRRPRAELVQALNGNFYGTTEFGGSYDLGTVFEITPEGVLTTLYSFTGGTDGALPEAALVEASDGNLYGTTSQSDPGPNPTGTVFRITTDGVLDTLYGFSQTDGQFPEAPLIQALDGDLYGSTVRGGRDTFNGGKGTVFKITLSGQLTTLHDFSDDDHSGPASGVIQGADGNFYGTTTSSLFKLTPSGVLTTVGLVGGSNAVLETSDGNFIGTTRGSSAPFFGTIFEMSPSGNYTTLYSFTGGAGGQGPFAGLIKGTDGTYYGTTAGDDEIRGTVFRFSLGPPTTSPPVASATVGEVFTYQITADNDPVSFNAAPLPDGLILDTATGVISGIPTQAGVFVIQLTATGSDGSVATGTLTLTISGGEPTPTPTPSATPAPLAVTISMHSVAAAAMANGKMGVGIDDPIMPIASDTTLKTGQPLVTSGLVADGVTPLLIEITPNTMPTQNTTFQITTSVTGGTVGGKTDLASHLNVLQYSGSTQTFFSGSSVVLSAAHPNGFAYISAIDSGDLNIAASTHKLTVTVTVQQADDPANTVLKAFNVARPPVVLVHGYDSDNGAWFNADGVTPNAFLSLLQAVYPAKFIIPVEYGVDRSKTPPARTATNRDEPFEALAPLLDSKLKTQIEGQDNVLRSAWAYTRFDGIGHSQGGLLLRMLCTSNDPSGAAFQPFRSADNAFRGRFHHIITIGSPLNGTTIARYLLDKRQLGDPIAEALFVKGLLQDKFDPWGIQTTGVNSSAWRVDPGAKFNLVGTRIYGGKAPPVFYIPFVTPLSYSLGELCGFAPGHLYSPGSVVIPIGSDGVVDYASEFASNDGDNQNTPTSKITAYDISHSSGYLPKYLITNFFAVPNADTFRDTNSVTVAASIRDLLTGPPTGFGSFVLEPLPASLLAQIDAAAGFVQQDGAITPDTGVKRLEQKQTSGSSNFSFTLARSGEAEISVPIWFAQVFGPSGVTAEGVTVTPDASDPEHVSVSVEDTVVGDVILYVSYTENGGNAVVGTPVLVASRPPGTTITGIESVPESISLSVGATPDLAVWADYDNGTKSQLFLPAGAATYNSSDSAIADVDGLGRLTLKSAGTATITTSYLGFSAQCTVTVAALPPPPAPGAPPPDVPSITTQPAAAKVYVGESASLSVTAGGAVPLAYQWQVNGNDISGATSPILSLSSLTQDQGGNYSVVVSNAYGITISAPALISVLPPVQLGNISTRLKVDTADNVLIGGFIVTGTQPKRVIVRAIGPSLGVLNVPGVLADPTLELHDSAAQLIATNDNWVSSPNKQAIVDSMLAPTDDKESAILMTLNPGAYTAIVRGANNTTGVGLVEVYDLDQTLDSKLANISTRGLVGTDDNVLIGGLIVLGKDPTSTIVRALGPTLSDLGVPGALADTTLELRDSNGAIITANDNWKDSQQSAIEGTNLAPSNDAESAIFATLSPGGYTAIVRGKDNTTGVALVEAYQLDQ